MLTNNRIKYTSLPLTDKERSQYCQLIGQLNWITNMTKPEFSFEVCYASTVVNSATISETPHPHPLKLFSHPPPPTQNNAMPTPNHPHLPKIMAH